MKLPASRVTAFLERPDPEIRAVLCYGPDAGLVRERAERLARTVCPDLRDPFRIADLNAAALAVDPARLGDEAAQLGLSAGRRVVRVRSAGDALAKLFAEFLENRPGDALVVAEAGDLPARSALRRTLEAARYGAAIGCYPDTPRDLAAVIRQTLGEHGIGASRDATLFLVGHLGGDRLLTRCELEKLTLYAGDGGRVELDDARLCISDTAALALDDAVMAAAEGDAARLERVLGRVFQEGESPVSAIRALLRHLHRLQVLAARTAAGATLEEVLRGARPPIFFKQEESFKRQLGLWTQERLRSQLDCAVRAERNIKTTGIPAETICREAMLAVARSARRH
ncbi:MAG: DNA polymerase III subunit delta [Alphaproteobacteria bacterium]|nr:DNA polymerase III subunit delta [Alphaproteobacteria bacterium]